jgi:hypothetical protein
MNLICYNKLTADLVLMHCFIADYVGKFTDLLFTMIFQQPVENKQLTASIGVPPKLCAVRAP